MSIEEVAHELYGLVPEEFTSARNARAKDAKASGDPELAARVQALRKPTAGAWLLNQLVRRHEEEVTQVLDLGARLRSAQGTLGAAELRDLDRQRRLLTHAVAEQARSMARQDGRRVSNQAVADVEETLRSAMVDAAAGAALRTGLLTDTFSSTGLDPVDLSRVVALADAVTVATPDVSQDEPTAGGDAPDPVRERRLADARAAAAEAQETVRTAREAADRAREAEAEAGGRREQLESARDEARRRLEELESQVATAVEAHEAATRERERAVREEAAAVEGAERLAEELDDLTG